MLPTRLQPIAGSGLVAVALLTTTADAAGAQPPSPPPVITGARVRGPVAPHLSRLPAGQLPRLEPGRPMGPVRVVPRRRPGVPLERLPASVPADPLVQRTLGARQAPAPLLSFDGVSATGSVPPDTVGDVGPSHYVQMVNRVFAVYDKSGNLQAGPSSINTLWVGAGGQCEAQNAGDPVVLYDSLADRWLLSQFALPANQCIAISTGPDPTGTYFLYEFALADFPDYPKFAVWPDAYYMGANSDPRAFAFDRTAMLAGSPATSLDTSIAAVGVHSMLLPSDLDGSAPPPTGAPDYFYRFIDGGIFGGVDRLEIFEFAPDFANPANSTFTGPLVVPVGAFNSLCGFSFDCIDQPGTTQKLDSITEWPMWRFQYRNTGAYESLVGNHAVDVGGSQAGIRWFELRKAGAGSWAIHQQGTFAPDGDSRWMGSIAVDGQGNIALGYSVSSTSTFPSVRYTGRLAGDTLGTMTLGEGTLVAGGGSQTGFNRWGDYSALSVDPVDDCTFWYTNEYYSSSSAAAWKTRIGSFSLCQGPPQTTIEWPPDGSIINQSTLIGFLGSATDPEDGDLTSTMTWESTLDGGIGTGGEFLRTLSVGSHTITARATDSGGQEDTDSIGLTVIGSGCSDHVALNQPVGGSQTIEARQTISTWQGFSITGGGDVTLRAGETVFLRDGSSVATGGALTTEVDPSVCP